jgi:hypothetical protein
MLMPPVAKESPSFHSADGRTVDPEELVDDLGDSVPMVPVRRQSVLGGEMQIRITGG